jgi:hypothetical protein
MEDKSPKKATFTAPNKAFLVAYFDPHNVRDGDITGLIQEQVQSTDYIWVLTDEPRDSSDCNIWVIPYAGKRYTYEFRVCDGALTRPCAYEQSALRVILRSKGVPRPGDTLTHLHDDANFCCVFLQTDKLLPGWDEKTKTLDECDRDELGGGNLCLVDIAQALE